MYVVTCNNMIDNTDVVNTDVDCGDVVVGVIVAVVVQCDDNDCCVVVAVLL